MLKAKLGKKGQILIQFSDLGTQWFPLKDLDFSVFSDRVTFRDVYYGEADGLTIESVQFPYATAKGVEYSTIHTKVSLDGILLWQKDIALPTMEKIEAEVAGYKKRAEEHQDWSSKFWKEREEQIKRDEAARASVPFLKDITWEGLKGLGCPLPSWHRRISPLCREELALWFRNHDMELGHVRLGSVTSQPLGRPTGILSPIQFARILEWIVSVKP